VTVHLHFTAATVCLEVVDDGVGFEPQEVAAERRGGLRTMAERTARVGGKLTYESQPGAGMRVRVEVTLGGDTGTRRRGDMDAAVHVFELSKGFPAEERHLLTDQVRRCSRSVCADIAEAWRKRRYPNAFVSKLSDTEAEAAETVVWLELAVRCGYLEQTSAVLEQEYEHILGKLVTMLSHPEQWTIRGIREDEAEYDTERG
jgi:four helix bundle protein